jgi:phosphoglycolate phosphatase-like HAD superfamily hydrolase
MMVRWMQKQMQNKVLAILFDFDDTLYTSPISISGIARKVLDKLGLMHVSEMPDSKLTRSIHDGPEAWLKRYMLINNVSSKWQPTHELWIEYCRILLTSLGVSGVNDKMSAELKSKWEEYGPPGRGLFRPQLVDRIENILEELQARGYRLGLSTNRIYSPEPVLEENSIIKYFSCVEHTGVPGYEKPSPYMLLRFATQVAVNPLRCAFVGDRIDTDVSAAINAGMIPVLANWNAKLQRNIRDGLLIANQIEDLLDIFPRI